MKIKSIYPHNTRDTMESESIMFTLQSASWEIPCSHHSNSCGVILCRLLGEHPSHVELIRLMHIFSSKYEIIYIFLNWGSNLTQSWSISALRILQEKMEDLVYSVFPCCRSITEGLNILHKMLTQTTLRTFWKTIYSFEPLQFLCSLTDTVIQGAAVYVRRVNHILSLTEINLTFVILPDKPVGAFWTT